MFWHPPLPVSLSRIIPIHMVVGPGVWTPVEARFTYNTSDPFAVVGAFRVLSNGDSTTWSFSRDLLLDGIWAPAGEGDVEISPSLANGLPVVCITLRTPDKWAELVAPADELGAWLHSSLALVPRGQELDHVSLDLELDLLLEGRI
ncbi:SsgA family sporulation/cell division regulator [Streptomyces fractus]|uniref:SsgA family sporulation/cell division regulator n=1 Tax=Streptomyces fractus TaxID=641806 RepID=UPI003CE91680